MWHGEVEKVEQNQMIADALQSINDTLKRMEKSLKDIEISLKHIEVHQKSRSEKEDCRERGIMQTYG